MLLLGCFLLIGEDAGAQFLRGYGFIAPAPNNGSPSAATTTFGILPAPQPVTPVATASSNAYLLGFGIEQRFNRYLGAGLDLAGIAPGGGRVIPNTIGTLSPNAYFHPAHADWLNAKADVYLTGGYTLLFRDFGANGYNAGAGVNYWFKDRLGMSLEFRFLKVLGTPPPPTFASHYFEVRCGLTFR